MPHHRREVSRVEGFSDAVFAFAITLLVVSLEVPKTFPELMAAMRGFVSIEGRRIDNVAITPAQVSALVMIYSAGVVAVFSILALLYRHAYRLRDELSLTPEDALEARVQMYSNVGIALVGVASILIALLCQAVAPRLIGLAGFVSVAIGIVEWRIGRYHGRQRKLLTGTASALTV